VVVVIGGVVEGVVEGVVDDGGGVVVVGGGVVVVVVGGGVVVVVVGDGVVVLVVVELEVSVVDEVVVEDDVSDMMRTSGSAVYVQIDRYSL
jgi:hypothetical protein